MTDLHLKSIRKNYKHNVIFEDLSFEFSSGNIYGIVGYNGSGKTVYSSV